MPTMSGPIFSINDPYEDGDEEEREVLGVTVERRDPYGFWYVKKPHNPKVSGAYTSIHTLENDLRVFGNQRPVPPKPTKQVQVA